uniref:TIGR02594 family protein n=1 Tax=Desulfobacca acetoxidans TaxID=60893 RepID=A0A7V4G8E4_9BACT
MVCAWMERAGHQSTRSAAAASWRNWGKELPDGGQRLGCVVVMSRTGGNHVGLYLDEDDVGVYCLGGNQGNRVSVRRYPWERITNFRWPA